MQIEELEKRNDAVWHAYCRIRDAANGSMHGSTALQEFGRVHALITDPDPERFKQFEKEVAEAEKKAPSGAHAPAAHPAAKAPDKTAANEPMFGNPPTPYADEEAEDDEDDAREASHSKPKGKK